MLLFFKHKHTHFSLGSQRPKFSSDWFGLLAYLFMFLLREPHSVSFFDHWFLLFAFSFTLFTISPALNNCHYLPLRITYVLSLVLQLYRVAIYCVAIYYL